MSRLKKLLGVVGLVSVLFFDGSVFADDLIRTFEGHKKSVNSIAFSPDGTMMASGSDDGTIKLWDVHNGELLNTLTGHKSDVNSVSFSPDSTLIGSGSDKSFKLWSVQSGRLLYTLKGGDRAKDRVNGVAFSPDATMIAFFHYRTIELRDARSGRLLRTIDGTCGLSEKLSSITFSSDGTMIVSGGDRGTIKLWNTHNGKLLKTLHHYNVYSNNQYGEISGVTFSPDGTKMVSGGSLIILWNVQSGKHKIRKNDNRAIESVAFSQDGTTMAGLGGYDNDIKLFDTQSGSLLNVLDDHKKKTRLISIAFSPGGTMVAAGSNDGTIKLWDVSPSSESLAKVVYRYIDKSDYTLLYAFTKKFYNHLNTAQQAYGDMHKELIKIHQMAFDKAKGIDTVSAYNTFVFAYPYASQSKEANQMAYELEKEQYTDIGMLGLFGKGEKMNKQARSLLIEAQSILDIALDKDKNASIIDTGYYMVVNRMYDLAKNEFTYTDRVLTLKESPELKRFDKKFQQKLHERTDKIKKIESGLLEDAIELRVHSTKAVISHAGSDSKMKEFYHEQTQKSNNFESLYQKAVSEYKSESKKAQRAGMEKATNISQIQRQKITQTPLELAKLGSKYLFQKNYIKAESYLEKACTGGNMPSCYNLAYLYINGKGIERDIQKAKELFMKSCNNDFLTSCTELGRIYSYGPYGIEKNEVKAMKLYAKSCDGGDAVACNSLGIKYDRGIAVEKNTKKANELYLKACNNGIVKGCFNLGSNYYHEFGINYDIELAKQYLNKACKKGHENSCSLYKVASSESLSSGVINEIDDLKKFKDFVSSNDATIAFWNDYGESISEISKTLVLGDEQNHRESDYVVSKILLATSQKEVKKLMRSSVLKYINTKKKINDVYLYLSYRMIKDFSTSKLTTLASDRKVEFYTTNATDNTNKIITLKNKMVFDTKKGKIDLGFKKGDVKYFIVTENTKDNKTKLQSQLYSENGEYVVIHMKSYGLFVVMDTETFNSTCVQMFILGKYDKDLFELVVTSPYSRIYKLKKDETSLANGSVNQSQTVNKSTKVDIYQSKKKAFWADVAKVAKMKGDVAAGEAGFATCMGCHTGMPINMGGVITPALDHAGVIYDKNYLIALMKDPAMASNVDHLYEDTMMHPMGSIKAMMADDQQIADVVAYIRKEKSNIPTPEQAFLEACSRCHAMKRSSITQLGKTPKFHNKKDALQYHHKVAKEEKLVASYLGKLPPDLSNITKERSEQFLAEFIKNPQVKSQGASMPAIGLSKDGYRKVMSYLKDTGTSASNSTDTKLNVAKSMLDSTSPQATNNESGSVSVYRNDSVNSNSSLVSKQKDQQQAQPKEPTSNQLTDAERQELEQLRAEKAKVTQKREVNSEPVNQSQTSNSRSFQKTREDTHRDGSKTYYARISKRDHYGKSGQKLKGVGIILQQDRANYHKYHKRDREDTGDNHFDTRDNRNKIKRMLARGSTSQKTLDAIRYGTPLVKVKIYPEYIDVTLEPGGGQTQQTQQKKNSAQPRQNKSKKSKCNTDGSIRGISRSGDGFVAVRKGPGTKYGMIGKIYRNGTSVKICDRKGKWQGVIYGDCISGSSRSRNGSCKAGWVYEKYIRIR